jgi:hypothetical protein
MSDAVAAEFSITFPSVWQVVEPGSKRARKQERQLVSSLGAGGNSQLSTEFRRALQHAREVGAVLVGVLAAPVSGSAVSATAMVISVGQRHLDLATLERIVALVHPNSPIGRVRLGGVDALRVRIRRSESVDLAGLGAARDIAMEVVEFYIPSPTAGHLLISFTTPIIGLADQFAALFDDLAATFRWT